MNLDFPHTTATLDEEALLIHSDLPLLSLSSGVTGEGFLTTQTIINLHVNKNYQCNDPAADLRALATQRGYALPIQGLMTAVYMRNTQMLTLREGEMTLAAIVTAGVGNATAIGNSLPANFAAGTINIILLIDAQLPASAFVNLVMVATEAKTASLYAHNIRTSEGWPATGTSTDAVCIASTQRGPRCDYAGPATTLGWLAGRAVRQCMDAALSI